MFNQIKEHPAKILMKSFVPKDMGLLPKRIRYIHIGAMAGAGANVTGEMLRTSGLVLSGLGYVKREEISSGSSQVWEWIKKKKLQMDIEKVPLAEIEKAWVRNDLAGKDW